MELKKMANSPRRPGTGGHIGTTKPGPRPPPRPQPQPKPSK